MSETVNFSNYHHYWVRGFWEKWKLPITFHYVFPNVFFCTVVVKRCFQKKNKTMSVFKPQLSNCKTFFCCLSSLIYICFNLSLTKQLKLNKGGFSCWLKYLCSWLFTQFSLLGFHDLEVSLGSTIKFEFSLIQSSMCAFFWTYLRNHFLTHAF